MARTHDPSAATKKAWLSRNPARDAGGGGVVQSRSDFAATGVPNLSSLISSPAYGLMSAKEKGEQRRTEAFTREAIGLLDLPSLATDGLTGLVMATSREMDDDPHKVVTGSYNGSRIRLNSQYLGDKYGNAENTALTLGHEVGHHVHLSKISDAAAAEWADISRGGATCKLSKVGLANAAEHFAEAFWKYAAKWSTVDDFGRYAPEREKLRKLEPKAHAFMERLWVDKAMWRPKGQVEYVEKRGRP